MRLPSARTVAVRVATGNPAGEANGPFCTFEGAEAGGDSMAVVMSAPRSAPRSDARPLRQRRRRRLLQQFNLPWVQSLQTSANADRAAPQQDREEDAGREIGPGGGGVAAVAVVNDGPVVLVDKLFPDAADRDDGRA